MTRSRSFNFLINSLLFLLVGGCAAPISKSFRQATTPGVTFPMVFENPDGFLGNTVIWGGSIIKTVTTQTGSKIYILQSPLDPGEKPQSSDLSRGRFIVTTDSMLDPLVYSKWRKLTVAGKVTSKKIVTHSTSGNSYIYPVVQSEQLYLWPRPETIQTVYWGPYWGPSRGYDENWEYPYFDDGFGGEDGGFDGGDHDDGGDRD